MEQLGSQRAGSYEIVYLNIFGKSVEKIQVSLKSDKNNGTLHEGLCTFVIICRWILLRIRNVSDKSCRENRKSHFMFNNSCRLWDNVEKYGIARQATDDNIIRRMRFACWITKATHTHTHTEYVILTAFARQQWLRERVSMLRLFVHCLSCCFFWQVALGQLFFSQYFGFPLWASFYQCSILTAILILFIILPVFHTHRHLNTVHHSTSVPYSPPS
jgi:hypothetical protein